MKEINNYPKYTINSIGEIYNNKGIKLKFYKSQSGYLNVTLYNKDGSKKFRVHRLVASHFIGNTNNKPHVNH